MNIAAARCALLLAGATCRSPQMTIDMDRIDKVRIVLRRDEVVCLGVEFAIDESRAMIPANLGEACERLVALRATSKSENCPQFDSNRNRLAGIRCFQSDQMGMQHR